MSNVSLEFPLYPKQALALGIPAQWKMYGGAAGGGKSHLLRVDAIKSALSVPNLQIYLFRRNYNELYENHMVGPQSFAVMLSPLVEAGLCKIVELEIRFWNGSRIILCHAQHESDVHKWKGPELHVLLLEEATEFTEYQVRFLVSRNRIPKEMEIPAELKPYYPKMLATTNPIGPSFSFWKNLFIEGHEPSIDEAKVWNYEVEPGEKPKTCAFIPALLRDNPSLDEAEYRASLKFLKRPELIDAMLNGRWDVPLGAFLPECDERKHLISPFKIPHHWFKFRTFDWGSQAPFAVGWWTVSDGTVAPYPRGALIQYREWYGCLPGDTRRGLGLSNEQVALGIREKTPADEVIWGTVTDSKPFQSDGGVTIAEQFRAFGIPLTHGDTKPGSRHQGAQQLRSRLIGFDDAPAIFFMRNCPHTWRTLTTIPTDPNDPEDADTDAEDHAYDMVTLACKTRPLTLDAKKVEPQFLHQAKAQDIMKQHFQIKAQRGVSRR